MKPEKGDNYLEIRRFHEKNFRLFDREAFR